MANNLRERLVALIHADGRSQRELSRLSGVSQPAISQIVSGLRGVSHLEVDTAVKLARALGLSPTRFGRLVYESFPTSGPTWERPTQEGKA